MKLVCYPHDRAQAQREKQESAAFWQRQLKYAQKHLEDLERRLAEIPEDDPFYAEARSMVEYNQHQVEEMAARLGIPRRKQVPQPVPTPPRQWVFSTREKVLVALFVLIILSAPISSIIASLSK